MSRANLGWTIAYPTEGKETKFPPETGNVVKGIDRASLRARMQANPENVITIPVEDTRTKVVEVEEHDK